MIRLTALGRDEQHELVRHVVREISVDTAATAGLMVPPAVRGKVIALVFLGWSITAVIGTPIGAYLGAHIGWRPTFGLVGFLAALFANTPLLFAISVTAIQSLGMFIMFSYMALLLKDFIGATPAVISMMFLCFVTTGVLGNVIGARVMDRLEPTRVGVAAMTCMLAAIVLWAITRGSLAVTTVLVLILGLGCFAINGAQQARLVALASELASASVSLNSSAIYLGQAAGAFIGGLIVFQGTAGLSFYSAVPMAAAIGVSLYAANLAGRRRTAEAA